MQFTGGSPGGYQTSGQLISSALNMSDNSPIQTIGWTETIPTCSPVCDIQMQVRTAPDSGGVPGTWTSWYGSSGVGTYFTSGVVQLISSAINSNRWVQYLVNFSGDGVDTPILSDVTLNYK
jgi:hypothetical protein